MEPRREARPDALAAALADGATIDWRAAESAAGGAADANLIHQLRVIAAMRGRQSAGLAARRPWLRQAVVAAFVAGVTLAAIKVIVAFAVLPAAIGRAPSPAGLFALNLGIFGVGGLLLVFGGSRDRRLQLLGGLYLTIAASFVDPFFAGITGPAGMIVAALAVLRPESMFALGVWLFAWSFPSEPLTRRARLVAGAFITAAAATGAGLFLITLAGAQASATLHPRLAAIVAAFDRQAPQSMYWPLLFALTVPAVAFLVARYRVETAERRRKVAWFLGALALGFAPLIVAVIATPFVPALRDEQVRGRVGLVVYLALGSIVPMTAYAVAVNRVMDLQFVIRATLQYALARYAIWAAILGPVTYLALDVIVNRGLTFVQYVNTRHPAGLVAFSCTGLLALTFRPQLIGAVDRWFLREPLDPAEVLARLERRFRGSESLRGISVALAEELAAALHAVRVTVLLLAEDADSLVALDGSAPPLPRHSVLGDLLHTTRSEVLLDARSALARLLPEADQDWIAATAAQVLSPLVGASGELLGVVAIGPGTSDLPYTERHVALATAMCGQAAMQLENRWLRETRTAAAAGAPAPRAGGVAWQDEPATWCPNCSETSSPDTRRCRCGTATRPAVLPLFVNAKFRLQRFLGAGGTGVVYLATDMALDRKVAIKTLPPMRREYAERLRREARAMASVLHPNLATIYGAEEWRDTPILIVEFLEGGTLLDWLARGPMPVDETLDLGIMLADVLDRVHGSGVLHRDIKPSNIGYTADGVPKLLDFGLAAMLDRSKGPDAAAAVMPADPAELAARLRDLNASSTLTITHQVVGTPLYLSPEALAGAPPLEAFDLWSLHMVLYEAMAGRHPFAGRPVPEVVDAIQHTTVADLRDVRPECPAAVAAYLNDALSRVASRRPASAADVRTALRALRTRLP